MNSNIDMTVIMTQVGYQNLLAKIVERKGI